MHEAACQEANCFITLTYEDDPGGLVYRHFQNFMKYLRKAVGPVRFYMCGEYGEDFGRPHFHACLFGVNFIEDRRYWRKSKTGFKVYRSALLESLWKHGLSEIGELSYESAAYVARYVLKKVNGDLADEHYRAVNPDTGEITWRQPEFTHMSLRPGIGAKWFERFHGDVYPHDRVVARGRRSKPPRYYDQLFERRDEGDVLQLLKEDRVSRARAIGDSSPERLAVKEAVEKARLSFYRRTLK